MSAVLHLAGIIPIACQPLDFGLPWHDCMQPIGKNYLLIERAVYECAIAGCETIWIVCPITIQPLIKNVLGSHIEDPVMAFRKFDFRPMSRKKYIPIYYVPVHPKDQEIRGSLPWSLLYGAQMVGQICNSLSKWLIPDRFYIAYPYGVYSVEFLRSLRKDISSSRQFVVQQQGGDFRNGHYTGFTCTLDDIARYKKIFRSKEKRLWDTSVGDPIDGKYYTKRLPLEERYTGRYLTLKDIFEDEIVEKSAIIKKIDQYYCVDSWGGLRDFLASKLELKKQRILFKPGRESNKISVDKD